VEITHRIGMMTLSTTAAELLGETDRVLEGLIRSLEQRPE
jgi:hypothetical protein